MPQPIRAVRYPFDPSGTRPENRIVEEHVINDVNRTDFNIIMPFKSPFFADNLVITHIENNVILEPDRDYKITGLFSEIQPYTLGGKLVGFIISLDDAQINGHYRVEYNTLGGDFMIDEDQYTKALAQYLTNPITTTWGEIVGKPLEFPSAQHLHHIDELTGWMPIVNQLKLMTDALSRYIEEHKTDNNKALRNLYQEVSEIRNAVGKDHGIRISALENDHVTRVELADLLAKLGRAHDNITQLQRQVGQDLQGQLTALSNQLDTSKRDLEAKLRQLDNKLTNEVETKLAALTSRLETFINNVVNVKIAELEEKLKSLDAGYKAGDVKTLSDAKAYADAKDSELKTELTGDYDAKLLALENRSKAGDAKLNNALTEARTALAGSIDSLADRVSTNERDITALKAKDKVHDTAIKGVNDDLTAYKGEVNKATAAETRRVNGEFDKLKRAQTEAVNTLNGTITTKVDRAKSDLTSIINAGDAKSLRDAKSYTDSKFNGLNSSLTTNINNAKRDLTNRINGLQGTFDQRYVPLSRLNSGHQAGNAKIPTFLSNRRLMVGNGIHFKNADNNHGSFVLETDNTIRCDREFRAVGITIQRDGGVNSARSKFTHGGDHINLNNRLKVVDLMLTSDKRQKKDIKIIEDALSKLSHISGVSFKWKKDDTLGGGVIAQEVQEVLPEAVYHLPDGTLAVFYNHVIGLAIEAIKELSQRNQSLESRLQALEEAIETISSKLG